MRDWILGWGRGRALERLGQLVNIAGILIAAGWFLALLVPHLRVITQPGPVEYNEPAIWQCTYLLDQGRNPYTAKELPGAAYCFDPLYNYLMLALKPVVGIDYTAHRLVNLVLLLGSLGLLARAICRAGAGLGIALLSVVALYWMCLYNIMITARPDLLGLFFFLLGILVPWENNYSRRSTLFGLACALVAFHCKLYFILAGCATLLGYFMVRAKREAVLLGVGFFAVAGLSFAVWCHFFPYYYIETVVVQRGGAVLNSSEEVSAEHTVMLFNRGWPFLLLMLYGVGAWLRRRGLARREGRMVNRPEDARFLALGTVFVIFLFLVYFYMGWNAGAYFTYHLHLLLPLMLVLAAHAITGPRVRLGYGVLLAVFVMLRLTVPKVPDADAPYRRLEHLLYTCRGEVLGIASVTDIFERQGRHVLHNGNTMFIGFAFADDGINRDPMIAVLADHYNATIAEVERRVAAREYELVLTEFDAPYFASEELLRQNYDKVEQVDYYTYFGHSPVRVWRPKPKASER